MLRTRKLGGGGRRVLGDLVHQRTQRDQGLAQGAGAVHHFVFQLVVRQLDQIQPSGEPLNLVIEVTQAFLQTQYLHAPVAAKFARHQRGNGTT